MATSALTVVNAFTHELGKGTHNFSSHVFKAALTNVAPTVSNSVLADITQIAAGAGYTAGGYTLDGITWTTAGGIAKLSATDEQITASGAMATFRYAVIYNDTATGDPIVGYVDYGAAISMQNGERFDLDFDSTNGLLTVAIVT